MLALVVTLSIASGAPKTAVEANASVVHSVVDEFTTHGGVDVGLAWHFNDVVALAVDGDMFVAIDNLGPHFGGSFTPTLVAIEQRRLEPERAKLYEFPWLTMTSLRLTPVDASLAFTGLDDARLFVDGDVGLGVAGLQLQSVALAPTFGVLPTMAPAFSCGALARVFVVKNVAIMIAFRDVVIPLQVNVRNVPGADIASSDVRNMFLAQVGVVFVFDQAPMSMRSTVRFGVPDGG